MKRRPLLALAAFGAARADAVAVRLIVGFAPGGTGDFVARALAEQLRALGMGGPLIVDNRPGGSGVLAVRALESAPADGRTLLSTPASTLTLLPHTHRRVPFDGLRDLLPLACVSELDFALACHAGMGARSAAEALTLAAARPALAIFATAGSGSMPHLLGRLLARRAGVELVHAPYRGSGPALQDLIGGQVPMGLLSLSEGLLRAHREGRVRLLATTGTRRSRFVPGIGTLQEAGFAGVAGSDWSLVAAPRATPPALAERLSSQLADACRTPAFAQTLARVCIEPMALARPQLMARLAGEHEALGRVVRDERISAEG